jgi:hypothetical protein
VGRRLRTALAAVLVRDNRPKPRLVHDWLDSWSGIGLIVVGMTRHGFQLGLDQRTGAWLAVFYRGSGGHEPIRPAGTAQASTPWGAVQRAAWAAIPTTAKA